MRRHPKGRSSKAAQDAYRRLMTDDISRLSKGIDLEPPAIDLDTLPQIDLALPEVVLDPDTGEEPTA